MKKQILLLLLMPLCIVKAQSIFKDDLSAYVINTPLNTQGSWTNNSQTSGLGGPCNTCYPADVLSKTMGYLNYGTTTKALEISPSKDGIGRAISPIITDGDLYIGMVLNLSNANASANDFLRVVNGTIASVAFRMVAQLGTNGGYTIGIRKGASTNATVFTPNELQYNQDNLIILKYSHLPNASDDVLSVYINPAYELGEPVSPTATVSAGIDQTGTIDRVAFRLNQTLAMPTGAVSLISVAKDWASLGFTTLGVNSFETQSPFTIITSQAHNGIINITTTETTYNAKMNIYDLKGVVVASKTITVGGNNTPITINPLQRSAIYLIQILGQSGERFTKKIVVE
jgi:hypothetical protein